MAYAAAFLDGADVVPANRAHEVGGARFLMLDSLVDAVDGERQDHGVLLPRHARLAGLRAGSRRPPDVRRLHHPPVEIGVDLMDPIKLVDAEKLAEVLGRHDHVVATLVGHAHTMGAIDVRRPPVLSAAARSPRSRSTRRTIPSSGTTRRPVRRSTSCTPTVG